MLTKHLFPRRRTFATLGAATVALLAAGCGGNETFNETLAPTIAGDPVVFGLQVNSAAGNQPLQVSGLGPATGSATTAYVTGAVASTAVVNPNATTDGGDAIPLGFAPGGLYIDGATFATGAPASGSVVFFASLANGVDSGSNGSIPINSNGVFLTADLDDNGTVSTAEATTFRQQLTFQPNLAVGPFANATYRTAAFTLPFTTTGLHRLVASVSDQQGKSSTTNFDVAVVRSTDAGVLVQVLPSGTGAAGSVSTTTVPITVTITNPITGARTQSNTDSRGVAIVFAAPGTQTLTATRRTGAGTTASPYAFFRTNTTVTLTAGQVLSTNAAGNAAFTVRLPSTSTAS